MIESNQAIFQSLNDYCTNFQDPVVNSDLPRWIATAPGEERRFIKSAHRVNALTFSATRRIIRVDYGNACYLCTVGFSYADAPSGFEENDLNAGVLTTILAELKPRPKATSLEVRNIVEASDKISDKNYAGHNFQKIAELYPPIRVFSAYDIPEEETLRLFFLACLLECRGSDSWIERPLTRQLEALCELDRLNIPYQTLCRSIFDADPAALFLALYRCVEALYAYTSAQNLIQSLSLKAMWADVAVALEDNLDWHPREEVSLVSLLNHAVDHDLLAIFEALGEKIDQVDQLPAAGKRIYKLRNGLVHFRPTHHKFNYENVNWNRLCEAMTGLVFHIYAKVFEVNK